ncbi:pentapeptide repeat-containing protein [Streptomyces sp. cg35]|uniref:pentapeptide repeat-containing protein n=1 Tax=Streptomyces sp. cg35 TaxID=3421650 RepID=UPI003D186BFC
MNPAPLVAWTAKHLSVAGLVVAAVVLVVVLCLAYRDRSAPAADTDDERKKRTVRQVKRSALAALAGSAIFVLLFWQGPLWFDGIDTRDSELQPADGVIVTGFRTGLVAFAAGVIAGAGLYYTHKKHELEQQQFLHAQQQFAENQKQFETTLRETQKRDERQAELTREGQVTDRYVEAIKLLASEKLHERLGGIYSLERIMTDSERDQPTIIEVLAAFVRNVEREGTEVAADMQAAINVMGRRTRTDIRIDLSRAHLCGANLNSLDFRAADFSGACLDGAKLIYAHLTSATFTGATLDNAVMTSARLGCATFIEASMRGADLAAADLTDCWLPADLTDANMRCAVLTDTSFNIVEGNRYKPGLQEFRATVVGTDFLGTDLRPAKSLPDAADLARARLFSNTELPQKLLESPDIQEAILPVTPDDDLDAVMREVAAKLAEQAEGRGE